MKPFYIKIFSCIFIISLFFSLELNVLAKTETPTQAVPLPYTKLQDTNTKPETYQGDQFSGRDVIWISWIADYIIGFYKLALWAISILVIINIMVGGFLYLTSMGNSGKITTAREFITNGFIAIAIIVFTYTILYYISPSLTTVKNVPVIVANVQNLSQSKNLTCETDAGCAPPLICSQKIKKCVGKGKTNSACTNNNDCGYALYCIFVNKTEQKCQAESNISDAYCKTKNDCGKPLKNDINDKYPDGAQYGYDCKENKCQAMIIGQTSSNN